MLNINVTYDQDTGALKIDVAYGALRSAVTIRRAPRPARRTKALEG